MTDATETAGTLPVLGLHHSAFRCRDSEETRAFYEDVVGFPLVMALEIAERRAGKRDERYMHTFFDIGSADPTQPNYLAFFEVPSRAATDPDDLYANRDGLDLHFAIRAADHDAVHRLRGRLIAKGVEVEGPIDHGVCLSIYFYDPNGYRMEFAAENDAERAVMNDYRRTAHADLKAWTESKRAG